MPIKTVDQHLSTIQSTAADMIAAIRIGGEHATSDFSPTTTAFAMCEAIQHVSDAVAAGDIRVTALPWHPDSHHNAVRLAQIGIVAFSAGDFASLLFVSGALCLLIGLHP